MKIKTLSPALFIALSSFPQLSQAAEVAYVADSTYMRREHVLREVEVLGLKNRTESGIIEAVTKVSGAEARRLGISDVKSLSEVAPNFYMPDYGSRMTSSIYVRGLGARIDQPVVGLNVDNIPYLNKDAYDFEVADIDRIEVLRGAQSLLNGRNTMGGQINILTLSPMRRQGIRARASYGHGNTLRLSAGYYTKLSAPLAMGLSATYGMTDGFFRNDYDNSHVGADRHGSLRWKTEWKPSERLSVINTATLGISRQDGYPYENVASGRIAYNDTCLYRRTHFADGITVAWAGKRVVVTSLTSVQYLDDRMTLDQDFLPEDYFTLTQKRREWTFTEDLFTRGNRGAYGWLGGVFAFVKSTDMKAPVNFKDTGIRALIENHRNQINPDYPISWDSRFFTLGSEFDMGSQGIAFYHESTYTLGSWSFEAGLRCDIEHNSLSYNSRCNSGYTTWHILPDGTREVYSHTPMLIDDGDRLSKTYVELLPKATVSYDFGNVQTYVSFSKAYKAGGYNTQMFSDVLQQRVMSSMGLSSVYTLDEIVSYAPEKSFNYELGMHSRLFGGKLDLDVAAFYIDCRDQQLTVFPPGTVTGRAMTNAGRTRSLGAEVTAEWHPCDDLTLRGSYGYTNATFRKYNNGRRDFRGCRVPYAPSNTLFATVDWHVPSLAFCGIVPSLCLSVRGAGDIYWNEENSLRQKFYCLPSASLTFAAEKWSLKVWGENLSDTRYNTFYFMSMGNSFVQRGRPVEFGATFSIVLDRTR